MEKIILSSFTREELIAIIKESVKSEIESKILPPKPKTVLISRKKAAEILGVSLPTLARWSKCGIVSAYRIGCLVKYKEDEVFSSIQLVKSIKYRRREENV